MAIFNKSGLVPVEMQRLNLLHKIGTMDVQHLREKNEILSKPRALVALDVKRIPTKKIMCLGVLFDHTKK